MKVSENLSNELLTLDIQDSMEDILNDLIDFPFQFISILDNGIWLGNISRNRFSKIHTKNWVEEIKNELNSFKLDEDEDILASLPLFENSEMDLIPVINEMGKWIGYFELNQLGKKLVHTNIGNPNGGIIKIAYSPDRHDITSITRIIEENKANIVRLFQTKKENSFGINSTLIIIQIESLQFEKIVKNLERHGYIIEKAFTFNQENNSVEADNFNHLMKFLNI
ncbi:MAG: hypothetical protein RIR51_1036 [Bacteroidota bacterium]|jgi:predicted transcriptional regulator